MRKQEKIRENERKQEKGECKLKKYKKYVDTGVALWYYIQAEQQRIVAYYQIFGGFLNEYIYGKTC